MQNFCSVSWDPDDKNTSEIPTEIQIAYSRSGKNIQQYLILIVWVPPKPFLSKNFLFLQYLQTFVMLKLKFRQRLSLSIQLNQTTQLLGPSSHWQCFFFSLLLFYSHDSRCVDETLMTGRNLCMNDAFSLCSTSAQLDYILCNTH